MRAPLQIGILLQLIQQFSGINGVRGQTDRFGSGVNRGIICIRGVGLGKRSGHEMEVISLSVIIVV